MSTNIVVADPFLSAVTHAFARLQRALYRADLVRLSRCADPADGCEVRRFSYVCQNPDGRPRHDLFVFSWSGEGGRVRTVTLSEQALTQGLFTGNAFAFVDGGQRGPHVLQFFTLAGVAPSIESEPDHARHLRAPNPMAV